MRLITERLTVAILAEADALAFAEYRARPEIAIYQSWTTDYTVEKALELVHSQTGISMPEPGTGCSSAYERAMPSSAMSPYTHSTTSRTRGRSG